MWLELQTGIGVPLSRQVYEQVKALILRGDLKAEEKLPSSRTLGQDLGIARPTVLEAYEQLLPEGYLEARHGSGTRVAHGIAAVMLKPGTAVPLPAQKRPQAHVIETGCVNFRSGIPALENFPQKEWGRLYRGICESLPGRAFRYSSPGGVWELREATAAYLFRVRGIRVPPERVMITSGSTQGLRIVAELLRGDGDTVLVEDPVHTGLLEVVARAGYAVEGLRADERGMDTSALETFNREKAARIAFAYVTPSHQYPLGGVLPVQRRQALISFAQAFGCRIVEDDYDSEFRYEGAPLSSLYELAPETVVYLGSLSCRKLCKSLGGGKSYTRTCTQTPCRNMRWPLSSAGAVWNGISGKCESCISANGRACCKAWRGTSAIASSSGDRLRACIWWRLFRGLFLQRNFWPGFISAASRSCRLRHIPSAGTARTGTNLSWAMRT